MAYFMTRPVRYGVRITAASGDVLKLCVKAIRAADGTELPYAWVELAFMGSRDDFDILKTDVNDEVEGGKPLSQAAQRPPRKLPPHMVWPGNRADYPGRD